jgi:uncharacterized membrane-anchored protein YhcB (DUF1043 family)
LAVGLIVGLIVGFVIARKTGKMARLKADLSNSKKTLREYHGKVKSHLNKTENLIHTINDQLLELQEHNYVGSKELDYRSSGYQITYEKEGDEEIIDKKQHQNKEQVKDSSEAPKDYVINKEHV